MTVGSGTDSPPVSALPIIDIMVAEEFFSARPVGNLIPTQAGSVKRVIGHFIFGGQIVIVGIWQLSAAYLGSHFGALFDNQGIGRNMVNFAGQGRLDRKSTRLNSSHVAISY